MSDKNISSKRINYFDGSHELIQYYKNGNIDRAKRKLYNGLYHKEDGPADINYYENGNLKLERYFQNGELHRKNGPAFISYNEDGSINKEFYYLYGKNKTKEDFEKEMLVVKLSGIKE